jgi:hypothetical protein
MSSQDRVEVVDPQAKNIIEIVKVIQMLRYQILETSKTAMAERRKDGNIGSSYAYMRPVISEAVR